MGNAMNLLSFVLIRLRRAAIILALTSAGTMVCGTAWAGDVNIYTAVSSFSWKEFNDNGSRLLKESGTLYGIGGSYWWKPRGPVSLQAGAELFGGNVDYDGMTQSGIQSSTTVDYFGAKLKIEAGHVFGSADNVQIEPFGGLGFAAWLRTINDGTSANGAKAYGYRENWKTLHVRLGLRARLGVSSQMRLFAESGVKLPVYNENSVDLNSFGIGDVILHPGRQASLFGELGLQFRHLKTSLFYDGMRFSRSDDEQAGGYIVYQPRSTADLIGLRLGVVF
jgi:hypothetical protein